MIAAAALVRKRKRLQSQRICLAQAFGSAVGVWQSIPEPRCVERTSSSIYTMVLGGKNSPLQRSSHLRFQAVRKFRAKFLVQVPKGLQDSCLRVSTSPKCCKVKLGCHPRETRKDEKSKAYSLRLSNHWAILSTQRGHETTVGPCCRATQAPKLLQMSNCRRCRTSDAVFPRTENEIVPAEVGVNMEMCQMTTGRKTTGQRHSPIIDKDVQRLYLGRFATETALARM